MPIPHVNAIIGTLLCPTFNTASPRARAPQRLLLFLLFESGITNAFNEANKYPEKNAKIMNERAEMAVRRII